MARVDEYLYQLIQHRGSDLHLPSGSPARIRIYGKLFPLDEPPLTPSRIKELAKEVLSVDDKEKLPKLLNVDFAYETVLEDSKLYRFRGNAFYQRNGLNLVFRHVPNYIPSVEELGLPEVVKRFTFHQNGLVLVTGPAGSGKTSSMTALVDIINRRDSIHITTIEQPIEFLYENKTALINQRQVGLHVESFALALKGALRQDSDVIVISDLRDLPTIELALTAAETGHLVFSTMHTRSAVTTINRLIDAFPYEKQAQISITLAEILRGVICQQLIPRTDRPGMILATEILVGTYSISNLIRENRTFQINSHIQTGRMMGMHLLDKTLYELYDEGKITREDALARCSDKALFEESPEMKGEAWDV
ncbi:MAG: PilT/PilU family type 4a pilus ATPase [Chloroflexi bacterium]|nr:PilT/PilU family type 4a pilus ATPase [Chloroflexota bacterium]